MFNYIIIYTLNKFVILKEKCKKKYELKIILKMYNFNKSTRKYISIYYRCYCWSYGFRVNKIQKANNTNSVALFVHPFPFKQLTIILKGYDFIPTSIKF